MFKVLLPIYEDLSNDSLLTRSIGGYTHNTNESYNNLIWRIAPKIAFSGMEIVEMTTYLATCIFNNGYQVLLQFLEQLHVQVGERAMAVCAEKDTRRLLYAEADAQK